MKFPSFRTTLTATAALMSAGALTFAGAAYSQQEGDAVALQNAKVSLSQAIDAAKAETGGTAVEAEFEAGRGKAFYELDLIAADGSEIEVRVDAETGDVVLAEVDRDERDGDDEDEAVITLAALNGLNMTLEEAILRAETEAGGQAIEAELELEDGQAAFEVELLKADGSEVELTFDAGKVPSTDN